MHRIIKNTLVFFIAIFSTTAFADYSYHGNDSYPASDFDIEASTIDVDVNGESFPVIDYGSGPVVLLLHGWPDSKELWRKQIPAIAAAGYRVIAPDLRGFGDAPRPIERSAYSFGLQIADVNNLLNAMGIGTVNVVGHDFGSALAWILTSVIPQRFTSLVALSTGSPSPTNPGFNKIRQREKSWYLYFFLQEGISEFGISQDNYQFLRDFTDHPDIDRVIEQVSRPGALTASLNWYRGNLQSLLTPADGNFPPPPPPFAKITVPVLGVWGTKDRFLTGAQMRLSGLDVEDDFTFVKVRGAGHWLMLERPRRINNLIINFLDCKVKGDCY